MGQEQDHSGIDDKAPQNIDAGGQSGAFRRIQVGRDHNIDCRNNKSYGELGEILYDILRCDSIRAKQYANWFSQQNRQAGDQDTPHGADGQAGFQVIFQIRLVFCAIALAKQRLQALAGAKERGDGKGRYVGDHRKRVDAKVANSLNQHKVHAEGHHRVEQLTDPFRQAMDNDVPEDAGVQFRPAKAEIALLAGKTRQEDQQTDGLRNACGNCRALCSHLERKN